jgi:hypothetical protein
MTDTNLTPSQQELPPLPEIDYSPDATLCYTVEQMRA